MRGWMDILGPVVIAAIALGVLVELRAIRMALGAIRAELRSARRRLPAPADVNPVRSPEDP